MSHRPWIALALAGIGIGCGGRASTSADAGRLDAGTLDAATCTSTITSVVVTGAQHVPEDQPLTYASNPPAGGNHYPEWVRWAHAYDVPIDPGYWVHNEEHGGVVLISRCATGCDDVMQALETFGQSLLQDPLCAPPINARWIVVRDPNLPSDTAVAAAAWGWAYRAGCFDPTSLHAFVAAHYGQGPERTCADGTRP